MPVADLVRFGTKTSACRQQPYGIRTLLKYKIVPKEQESEFGFSGAKSCQDGFWFEFFLTG